MQKTAYEMRISDWISDVCSSDRAGLQVEGHTGRGIGVGYGIRTAAADHGRVRRVDHDDIVTVIAVTCGIGTRAADDDIAIVRADHILDVDIGIAGRAAVAYAGLQVDLFRSRRISSDERSEGKEGGRGAFGGCWSMT